MERPGKFYLYIFSLFSFQLGSDGGNTPFGKKKRLGENRQVYRFIVLLYRVHSVHMRACMCREKGLKSLDLKKKNKRRVPINRSCEAEKKKEKRKRKGRKRRFGYMIVMKGG